MAQVKEESVTVVDNSVPYPEAPAVDHDDLRQEHYRGARDPELAKKTVRPKFNPWDGHEGR